MQESKRSRGYSVIALHKPIKEINIGHALRSAGCFNANMVVISETKYQGTMVDTQKMHKHIPLMEVENFKEVIPYDCTPVAVECMDEGIPLHEYQHPERAFYIFGPENGSLDDSILSYCKDIVTIPAFHCLNLGACTYIVLYDRYTKQLLKEKYGKNRSQIFSL